jgi:uncharacterized membrane protein (UPF0127 family)
MVLQRCGSALVVVAMTLLAGCAQAGLAQETVSLGGHELRVWTADSPDEQSRGLSDFDGLADGEGMLFVFAEPSFPVFGIKDVSFPIEVVFVAEDGRVSAIEPLSPGESERRVTSDTPSLHAIELPQGWCAGKGVSVGSVLERDSGVYP